MVNHPSPTRKNPHHHRPRWSQPTRIPNRIIPQKLHPRSHSHRQRPNAQQIHHPR